MVDTQTAPATAEGNPFAEEEAFFSGGEAFKPTEFFELREIADIQTVAFPEDALVKFGIAVDSELFRATFPNGVPTLEISVRGINVEYAWDPERIKRIQIPMINYQGKNFGKPKGENSQLEITLLAFQKVYGVKPFGKDNRAKLIGKKGRWGQHIGRDESVNNNKPWRWDVPREALADDFIYTGDVKIVGAGSGDASAAVASASTKELSAEDAQEAVLSAIVGMPVTDMEAAMEKVLNIPGLPGDMVDQALNKTLLATLAQAGLIDQADGVIIRK